MKLIFSDIAEHEKTPIVRQLLSFIDQQANTINELNQEIQKLKDEVARVKKQTKRPKIKPSRLEKPDKDKNKNGKKKRPGSEKRKKTVELEINETKCIEPEHIPEGSKFKYYKPFVVQDIKILPYNICYRLKVYETPDGNCVSGQLPEYLNGAHFGPALIQFILYQHHHCHVTQPLLHEQLRELGIDISKGQLNNILIENKDLYHQEKDRILAMGLDVSGYINVDDTGARHQGQNGYCTHIGNELFSWFESTQSKSRINFLRLLRAGRTDFVINLDAIGYMESHKLPKKLLQTIIANHEMIFSNDLQWNAFMDENGIVNDRHVQIVTEGALIGAIVEHGISDNLVIVSDDAGQFNVLLHALCWIHANRAIDKIIPVTQEAEKDLDAVKDQIWQYYRDLKAFQANPKDKVKKRLSCRFDEIFTQQTSSPTLNNALKRIYKNKSELLLVLERPDIPLHNNGAENPIRDYVKRRKISGGTRSESGRKCRDTFTSLKKTCRKLGVSFWDFLKDRIKKTNHIPDLSEIIRQRSLKAG